MNPTGSAEGAPEPILPATDVGPRCGRTRGPAVILAGNGMPRL
jgi:hypothetical protein